MKSKGFLFTDLVHRVEACNLCPRMKHRRRVLTSANGNLNSPVVFVAEAPGRLGAERFGIPLHGDQTGRNFEMLLASTGLRRESVFISNAVLCNPRTPNGNNDSPSLSEIRNCSQYLKETLEIIEPKYIVPLGAKALAALNRIEPINLNLSESVGKLYRWHGRWVFPLYHPGPRAFIWRARRQQVQDYRNLGRLLNKSQCG